MAEPAARKPTIQCPDIPAALSHGLPPPGSAQWCAWIDDLRDFVARVGEQVAAWLDKNIDYWAMRNALNAYRESFPHGIDSGNQTWYAILGWVIDVLDVTFKGFDILKDLLSCAWHWHKVVLPAHNPAAYIGCLIVRNVLKTISKSEGGPEWVAKITINIVIEIPALLDAIEHLMDYLLPMQMPSVSEATSAWTHGYIDHFARDCVWKYYGYAPEGYEPYILSQSTRMGFQQAMELARRTGADDERTLHLLLRAGAVDQEQRDALRILYDRLQTQSEALQWTRANVISDTNAKLYGLDSGFADDYWQRERDALEAQGITAQIARYNYRLHWAQLGTGQMQHMLYRLRRDNPTVTVPFTEDDYRAHLVMSGHTPWQIERLMAVMHRPLSTSEAHDLFRRGLMGPDEVMQLHMATGVSPTDAGSLLQRDQQMAARWRASQYGGWTPQSAGRAFAIGILSHSQLVQTLSPQGIAPSDIQALESRAKADLQYTVLKRARARLLTSTVSQVKAALRVGVMDVSHATTALEGIGWPHQQARGIAQIEDAAARVDRAKHAITHLRGAFLQGEIDIAYVRHALQQLGVVPSAISSYIAMWEIENTPSRKRRNAKQIVNDVAEGAITTEDAAMRLRNLGYTDVDTRLYLADAHRAMVTTEAARMAAVSGNSRQLDSELQRVAHASAGLSRRVVADLQKRASPARLKSYFVGSLLGEQEIRERLQLYGWDESSIDLFVKDAQLAKDKRNAPKAPTAKPAAPSSTPAGQGTDTVGSAPTAVS